MMSRIVSQHKATYADMVYSLLPHDLQQKVFDNVFNDYNKDKDNFMDILIVKNHLIRLETEYDYDIEKEREILFKNMKNVLLNNTSFISNSYEYFEEYLTSIIDDIYNNEIKTDTGYELNQILKHQIYDFYCKITDLFRFKKNETKEEVLNDFNGLKDVMFSNDISFDNPKFKQFLKKNNYIFDDTINEYNYHLKILEKPDEHSVKKLNHSLEELMKRVRRIADTLTHLECRRLYHLITTG
jgi:hypothetical protein